VSRSAPRRLVAAVLLASASSCSGSSRSFPPPARTVHVDMREYRFDYRKSFRAGRTVVRVRNRGELVHQLVLINLPADVPPLDTQLRSGERRVVPTIVDVQARPPGATGSFAVDLDPGRYGFVCFVQDPDGRQHAQKGMSSEFRVR
jgi:uncharacterized cupredoxin-like copper-binding protein